MTTSPSLVGIGNIWDALRRLFPKHGIFKWALTTCATNRLFLPTSFLGFLTYNEIDQLGDKYFKTWRSRWVLPNTTTAMYRQLTFGMEKRRVCICNCVTVLHNLPFKFDTISVAPCSLIHSGGTFVHDANHPSRMEKINGVKYSAYQSIFSYGLFWSSKILHQAHHPTIFSTGSFDKISSISFWEPI